MKEIYRVATTPQALTQQMVTGEHYRITVLTPGLLRLEYSDDGVFEDRATQMVWHRDFQPADYRVIHTEDGIEIHTEMLQLIYNEKEFSANGLSIQVKGNLTAYHSIWRYGEPITDLGGTARTLDEADGAVPLDHGVASRNGFSVLDDSRSQVLLEDGWIETRKKGVKDLYFFGYGHNYKQALADFYYLCGKTPMLPRFALGNWWSRYYRYTEESYRELMDRFERENLPFTVAVIDMDWHLVDIDPKYGSGWTGYTWNKELFPDPKRFLQDLHRRGMRTTLNVHPADGVRAHEERYPEMAKAMGVDASKEDPVVCDPASPKFMEAYFEYLNHPLEDEGVDFWWIDWQQGSHTKVEGLDPLWIFNHYHFLDGARGGKRPMTFSRYAGPGSHRYPVGFSGDTITTWESLDFQPYFTSTATNVGYGWWSHDIGGHMMGYKNDEMVARWVQYGVYSPIMRLHSSCSEFNGKEPWRYKAEVREVIGEMLRERHRLMPYLYTMNYRSYHGNLPLVMPLYYESPEEAAAYEMKNEFYFGTELLVAPITSPRKADLNVAKVTAWLPEGTWYDIYTGMMYDGGRTMNLYRDLNTIPVFAKAGAILPMTEKISGVEATSNPEQLTLRVFAGADGAFELYEDDNETCNYETGVCCVTKMTYAHGDSAVFTIEPAQGKTELIPEKRQYTVVLTGWQDVRESVQVTVDGTAIECEMAYDEHTNAITILLPAVGVTSCVKVTVKGHMAKENHVEKRCFDFLNQAEIGFTLKDRLYQMIQKEKRVPVLLAQLSSMDLDEDLLGVLTEILTALS